MLHTPDTTNVEWKKPTHVQHIYAIKPPSMASTYDFLTCVCYMGYEPEFAMQHTGERQVYF